MTTDTATDGRRPAVVERDTPSAGSPARPRDAPARLAARIGTALRDEQLLIAVLVSSFIARWLLADRTSLWLDELLSVLVYGSWHDNVGDAVSALAADSVHPPLYQMVLYYWMDLFGDGERAARSLSNLFITLATLFLYLLLRDAFSRRVALASAVAFALMYSPTFYGLEGRSYAQTMFLATLSSYTLLRLMRAGEARGWWRALRSPTALVFLAAGLALLLTHYFNVFFWVAQGILAGCFVLRERSPRGWLTGLATVVGMYAAQGGAYALIWGRVLLDDYRQRGDGFAVGDGGVRSPWQMLERMATPNIDAPWALELVGLALVAVLLVRAGHSLLGGGAARRQWAWTVIYLVGWLVLPFLVVATVFDLTGVARYVPRYWLAAMPPLAPLLVLAINEAVRLVRLGLQRLRAVRLPAGWSTTATVVAVAALVLPGTVQAATEPKGEYRAIARQVVELVEADPEHDYLIYQASYLGRPVIQYYFDQFSDDVEVYGILRWGEERRGNHRILTSDAPVVGQHDHLVVLFPHLRTMDFPDALEQLTQRYPPRLRQLDQKGRGFIIFDIHPSTVSS